MKGSRPLTDLEAQAVTASLAGGFYGLRNQALFVLGHRSGFRISELLSLTLGDVFQASRVVDRVTVNRRHMKKKREGRTVVLHSEARDALALWVARLITIVKADPSTYVFRSREGGNRPIDRRQAWRILMSAYQHCGLTGKLGTHAMRKTFAKRVYKKTGNDLLKTQKALGHTKVETTMSYLSFSEEELEEAILAD